MLGDLPGEVKMCIKRQPADEHLLTHEADR